MIKFTVSALVTTTVVWGVSHGLARHSLLHHKLEMNSVAQCCTPSKQTVMGKPCDPLFSFRCLPTWQVLDSGISKALHTIVGHGHGHGLLRLILETDGQSIVLRP